MKLQSKYTAIWLLSMLLWCGFGLSAQAVEPPTVDQLSWMAGCWASEGGEPGSVEQWMRPAGGTMIGMSRTVSGGKTVFYEFLILRTTDGGGLELVALPSGQSETAFSMVSMDTHRVTFENPQNDFPQRILYWLKEDGHLAARIEGESGGETKHVDFAMRRQSCP